MKKHELKKGMEVWSWWLHRYLYYNGRAYNAKDYEFIDIDDRLFILSEEQINELKDKAH